MDTPKTNPATGTSTPVVELNAEEANISLRVSLADLIAKGNAMYAQRNYEEASEIFSRAAEMQDEMNSEMHTDNAELLFLYGRSLFKVGQAKSDVLGGRAPAPAPDAAAGDTPLATRAKNGKKQQQQQPTASSKGQNGAQKEENDEQVKEDDDVVQEETDGAATIGDVPANGDAPTAEDAPAENSTKVEGKVESVLAKAAAKETPTDAAPNKPLFTFEGDENLVDEDDDEDVEEAEAAAAAEEDEDDLAVAFEILDMSRLLHEKQLEAAEAAAAAEPEGKGEPVAAADNGKGKDAEAPGGEDASGTASKATDTPKIRHIKERLADTFDLQAEISLENERYPSAITDFRKALHYKRDLFPDNREIMSEAHFKLSLALEFASVTTAGGGEEAENQGEEAAAAAKTVDEGLRGEAAEQLEAAIAVLRAGLQAKEVELATLHSPEDNEVTRARISESRELIADMEQRLVDLRAPPVDLSEELGLKELLGSKSSTALQAGSAAAEEATRNATDLTGLVRKKRKAEADPDLADGEQDGDDVVACTAAKRAKGSVD